MAGQRTEGRTPSLGSILVDADVSGVHSGNEDRDTLFSVMVDLIPPG